jgi:hypothetical protein
MSASLLSKDEMTAAADSHWLLVDSDEKATSRCVIVLFHAFILGAFCSPPKTTVCP